MDKVHQKIYKTLRNFCSAFCVSMLSLSPVWADDTEIFFGDFNQSNVAPNVMFIVDTSGSMSGNVNGTGMTRMQNVQAALRTLLTNLNDVNVGMMRFSNPGGPVLYQVDYIDRDVTLSESGDALVVQSISAFEDDVQEITDVAFNGIMLDFRDRLEMSQMYFGGSSTTSVVNSRDDDAEEEIWKDRCTETRSSTFEITHNDASDQLQAGGLRFHNLNIPPTATVTRAYITFVAFAVDSAGLAEVTISGETKDSGQFDNRGSTCNTSEKDDISGRAHTTAVTEWDLNTNLAADEFIETPDLSAVVQEIISDAGWVGDGVSDESSMVFMFERRSGSTANGRYDFYTYDGNSNKAPRLTIEYYDAVPPATLTAATGLRFQDINVPKGATITSARIDFVASEPSLGAASMKIAGEAADDSAPFDSSVMSNLTSRSPTTATVDWNNIPEWTEANVAHPTPDLSPIVQEIVNRSGWCGGNSMSFYLDGTGLRTAFAREADNGWQPQLTIEYDPDSVVAGSSCGQAVINKGVTASLDDIEDDGDILSSGNVHDIQSGNNIGLRFTGINIPKNAVISSAYIQLVSNNGDSGSATIQIKAEQADDAATFTNSSTTLTGRSWSSAETWSISSDSSDNWSSGEVILTPDIKTLVQGLVNRSGWQVGNDMVFLLDHTSGSNRRAVTYDNNPVQAPRLIVNFQDDGSYSGEVRLVRDELLEVVDSLNTRGYTPIQDTLYEAALYFTGGEVDYGAYRGGPNDSGPHDYTRVSVADSMVDGTYTINRPAGCTEDDLGANACEGETISGLGADNATYDSPINDWCQTNNHIILLTDGQANRPHSETKIEDFIDDTYTCVDDGVTTSEMCVKDLVKYLYENDQSALKENQKITTHTIGFNFSSQWLADVAEAGGGQYREATQAADLVEEIEKILTAVLKTNTSFVAPVAAINQFNRLNHRREIYFAVFRPDEKPQWPGNLKRYRLRTEDNKVVDYTATDEADSLLAVNPDTGFFSDQARSAWTPDPQAPDGKEVDMGGAGSVMPGYDARKLYTWYAGSTSKTLSNAVNQVKNTNNNLTKAMFGVGTMTDAEFDDHIDWVRGKDLEDEDSDLVTAENRYLIADPLHSKPVAITYGGTEADPDLTIYLGTNSGFLHAINAKTGVEQFAYIPEEMLPLQNTLRTNASTEDHPYGIDGSITPWIKDVDADGVIEPGDGDFVRLFFGMRRGGNKYFALDVSDRNNPKMLWQIQGGSGDYAELGQTWSQPIVGRIKIGSTVKDVLFFSGGYDENQDNATKRQTDSVGRAIFIADATTGDLVWSGGNGSSFTEDFDDMLYSIPANLSVAVVQDEDKYDDMIFVGDMGGQVWRFDINNGADLNDLITGGVIADLGVGSGGNTVANNRRFYHSPDIALIDNPDGNPPQMMTISIGSGFHAHPLSTGTNDRFYMIEQPDIYAAPSVYTRLTHTNLYDATDNEVGEQVDGAAAALSAKSGWYFDMPRAGEKVLSTPLTFRNTITFTTYEPSPEVAIRRCAPAAGVSRFYQVGVKDASPVNNWDDIDGLTEDDRSTYLQSASIIDEPVIVCTGTGCDMFAGAEQPDIETGSSSRIVKTFWRRDN